MTAEIEQHLALADHFLGVAEDLRGLGHSRDTVNRAYYAVFHAATAVLVHLDIQRSSHHGLWSAFGQFVTAPGLLEVRYHRLALNLFLARNDSDYLPQAEVTAHAAENALSSAREFVAACREFLESR